MWLCDSEVVPQANCAEQSREDREAWGQGVRWALGMSAYGPFQASAGPEWAAREGGCGELSLSGQNVPGKQAPSTP